MELPFQRFYVTHRNRPEWESTISCGVEYLDEGFQLVLAGSAEGEAAWTAFSFWAPRAGTGNDASAAPEGMVRVRLRSGEFFAYAAADAAPAGGAGLRSALEGILILHAKDRLHVMLTRHAPAKELSKLRAGRHWCGWFLKHEVFAPQASPG